MKTSKRRRLAGFALLGTLVALASDDVTEPDQARMANLTGRRPTSNSRLPGSRSTTAILCGLFS